MDIDVSKLAQRYGVMVSTIAHRMIQNSELAKEAAQEAWYEVIKSLPTFNGGSELSTWIYIVAKRTILRYAKNERTATMAELEAFRSLDEIAYNGDDESRQAWVKEKCDWCLTALNHCLSNEARLIFIFRENLGLPYRQVAEIMELKEDAVRQVSLRSFRKISSFMNNTCPLYNPSGSCKCRIRKQVRLVELDRQYAGIKRVIRLVDLYQRFEKELPRKSYWEKLLP